MAQLTKTQLIKSFNNGELEKVHKELTRYAAMVVDKNWAIDSGHYAGYNRLQKWEYKGLRWESLKINGDVIRLGWKKVDA